MPARAGSVNRRFMVGDGGGCLGPDRRSRLVAIFGSRLGSVWPHRYMRHFPSFLFGVLVVRYWPCSSRTPW
ncbi:hypothetical protein RJ55_05588 [Drechmeria coniospora]|nr:hypothetical protein RJ55_05588 [Drechmeria coniospora]